MSPTTTTAEIPEIAPNHNSCTWRCCAKRSRTGRLVISPSTLRRGHNRDLPTRGSRARFNLGGVTPSELGDELGGGHLLAFDTTTQHSRTNGYRRTPHLQADKPSNGLEPVDVDDLRDARWSLVVVDFEGEVECRSHSRSYFLGCGDDRTKAHSTTREDWREVANLVRPNINATADAQLPEIREQHGGHRLDLHTEGDRAAVRRLLGVLGVDMDRSAVPSGFGEVIDLCLRHGVPFAPPEVLTNTAEKIVGLRNDDYGTHELVPVPFANTT